jgi:hypothetical protein
LIWDAVGSAVLTQYPVNISINLPCYSLRLSVAVVVQAVAIQRHSSL